MAKRARKDVQEGMRKMSEMVDSMIEKHLGKELFFPPQFSHYVALCCRSCQSAIQEQALHCTGADSSHHSGCLCHVSGLGGEALLQ